MSPRGGRCRQPLSFPIALQGLFLLQTEPPARPSHCARGWGVQVAEESPAVRGGAGVLQSEESPAVRDWIPLSLNPRSFCPDMVLHFPSHSFFSLCLSAEGGPSPLFPGSLFFLISPSSQLPTYLFSSFPIFFLVDSVSLPPRLWCSKSFGFYTSLFEGRGKYGSPTSLPCWPGI